jgi:hypothetical protein
VPEVLTLGCRPGASLPEYVPDAKRRDPVAARCDPDARKHASAAINLLQYGDDAQVQAVLAMLKQTAFDPWTAESLVAALTKGGVDSTPCVLEATDDPR